MNSLLRATPIAASFATGIVFAALTLAVFNTGSSSPIIREYYYPASTSITATIVISNGIDVIDSGVTFNPPFARVIMGINNTVTWINQNDTSIVLQAPYGGHLFKNVTMTSGESFTFTFGKTGLYHVYEVNAGKSGTVLVSSEELESSRLAVSTPSILQDESKDLHGLATTVIKASQKDDDISSMRLNNTQMVAYTTEKDADIIVYRLLCALCYDYGQPVFYRSALGEPIIYPSEANMEKMKNFANAVMQEIGYTMDGTEWVDAVNYGDRVDITISQQVNGDWILPVPGAHFSFKDNWTWIELGRWYDSKSISSFKFGLGSEQAKQVAIEFMNAEASTNTELAEYKYQLGRVSEPRITVIDDKVMYVVSTSYSTTNPIYYDDRGHCGEPASGSFDVFVDAANGAPFGWRYAACA